MDLANITFISNTQLSYLYERMCSSDPVYFDNVKTYIKELELKGTEARTTDIHIRLLAKGAEIVKVLYLRESEEDEKILEDALDVLSSWSDRWMMAQDAHYAVNSVLKRIRN